MLVGCSHSSSSSSSNHGNLDTSSIDNEAKYAGDLTTYCFTGNVSEVVDFLTYTVNEEGYECDCGENCTDCDTEIKIKVVEEDVKDIGSLVEALNKVPEGKTVYLDIHYTYINASDVFKECSKISGIVLAAHHEKIEENDFNNCENLEKVYFSDWVTSIEKNPFYGCDKLTEIGVDTSSTYFSTDTNGVLYSSDKTRLVLYPTGKEGDYTLDNSTETIGSYAFYGCTSLKSVKLPASLTSIGSYAFYKCSSLESIDMSNCTKLESIDTYAFYKCTSLEAIDLSNCTVLTTIGGEWTFYGCSSLTSVDFPQNLKTIGKGAFRGCTSLTSIDISNCTKLTRIEAQVFYLCSALETVNMSNCTSLITIGDYAFQECTSLTSIDISNCTSLQSIETQAFYNCSKLTNLGNENILPSSLERIWINAFRGCNLGVITLPQSVKAIGDQAFYKAGLNKINITTEENKIWGYIGYFASNYPDAPENPTLDDLKGTVDDFDKNALKYLDNYNRSVNNTPYNYLYWYKVDYTGKSTDTGSSSGGGATGESEELDENTDDNS